MIAVYKLVLALITGLIGSALGSEAHNSASPLARRLIDETAKWYPEHERDDFIDEMSLYVEEFTADGRHLWALGISINEWRSAAQILGLPAWLRTDKSDRFGSLLVAGVGGWLISGLSAGLCFGVLYGLLLGPSVGLSVFSNILQDVSISGMGVGFSYVALHMAVEEMFGRRNDDLTFGLKSGLFIGLAVAGVVGLLTGLNSGLQVGLVSGLSYGLGGFAFGMLPWFGSVLGHRLMSRIRRRLV